MPARQQGQQAQNSPELFRLFAKLVSRATDNPHFFAGRNMLVEMEPIISIKACRDDPRENGAAVDAVVACVRRRRWCAVVIHWPALRKII
jgi:hypothetical protein